MDYIFRDIQSQIASMLQQNKSILLLGPRQTGKTTMIAQLEFHLRLSLIRPRLRQRYEKDPELLIDEVEALNEDKAISGRPKIVIDEVQKVPAIMDAVQDLIDRKLGTFLLTGSSARKLRCDGEINLLPGRVLRMHLDPLAFEEIPRSQCTLENLLRYGSLPGIVLMNNDDEKETLLDSYVSIYLEEEVRAEALVRNLGHFGRFLELAASESGNSINFSKLSHELGISRTVLSSYYQILKDCLIVEAILPLTKSRTRKKLIKSEKYLFFDLGVRRVAAKEGISYAPDVMGLLFEQFVGLELLRIIRQKSRTVRLHFWKDADGPEVDWVVDLSGRYIPIEVKWTDAPRFHDARHLRSFLNEYKEADEGYVICRTPHKMKLGDQLYALPWSQLHEIFGLG